MSAAPKSISARGISQRLSHAGHTRNRRSDQMFAGVTGGFEVRQAYPGMVQVTAVVTTRIHPQAARQRMLGSYTETLTKAGFAVFQGEQGALAVSLPQQRVPLRAYQDEAIGILRAAVSEGRLPVNVGWVGQLADVVSWAYKAGERDAESLFHAGINEVVKSYEAFLDAEDGSLEMLQDALGELIELTK